MQLADGVLKGRKVVTKDGESHGALSTSAVETTIDNLFDPAHREAALSELSSKREEIPDLALILWNRRGNP